MSEPKAQAKARCFGISSRFILIPNSSELVITMTAWGGIGQMDTRIQRGLWSVCFLPISFELRILASSDHRGIDGDAKSTDRFEKEELGRRVLVEHPPPLHHIVTRVTARMAVCHSLSSSSTKASHGGCQHLRVCLCTLGWRSS